MQRGDLWVFGYGSLMWNPGFDYVERRIARLDGFTRRFALTSRHYRGTPEKPGLVLGLDWAPGQSCTGVAFRIDTAKEQEVRDYLVQRELISYAYFEARYPVTLLCDGPGKGEAHEALCYVVDRSHPQYAGDMARGEQAWIIADAVGPSGPNYDYLMNTLEGLENEQISDDDLSDMAALVRACRGERPVVARDDLTGLNLLDRVDNQVGALAWQRDPDGTFGFMIVTSKRSRRWVLPKGSIDPGFSAPEAAAQEALEEAGVSGEVAGEPVGTYRNRKIRPPNVWTLEIALYPIRISQIHKTWDEQDMRARGLVTLAEAEALGVDDDMLAVVRAFADQVGQD